MTWQLVRRHLGVYIYISSGRVSLSLSDRVYNVWAHGVAQQVSDVIMTGGLAVPSPVLVPPHTGPNERVARHVVWLEICVDLCAQFEVRKRTVPSPVLVPPHTGPNERVARDAVWLEMYPT
jgi:hypothetical protein